MLTNVTDASDAKFLVCDRHQNAFALGMQRREDTKMFASAQLCCIMLPSQATGGTSRLTHSPTCQEAKQITRRNPPIGIT